MSEKQEKIIKLEKKEGDELLLSSISSNDIIEKVKKYSEVALNLNYRSISIFRGQYLPEINYLVSEFYDLENKDKLIDYFSYIENTIGNFIGKELDLGYFVFGPIILNKFKNILLTKSKQDFDGYFNNNFLPEFYKIILNLGIQKVPHISEGTETTGINPTVFCDENNDSIDFEFKYLDSKELKKQSIEDSKINLAIEEKDKDIYENKLLEQIDQLNEISNTFHRFITNLIENKNTQFIILRNLSLNKDYLDIKFFINKNKKNIDKNKINSLYVSYFISLIKFIGDNRNTGTLNDFNKYFNYNNNLDKNDLELYNQIKDTNIFYIQMIQEFDHITDFIIEDLESELSNKNTTEGILIDVFKDMDNNVDSKALVLENKIDIYIKDFKKIIDVLYKNKNKNIGIILNNNGLLNSQENIYYFIDNNKEKFLKTNNGKIIYNFIYGVSYDMLNITFEEYLEKNNIQHISLFDFPRIFGEIIAKL